MSKEDDLTDGVFSLIFIVVFLVLAFLPSGDKERTDKEKFCAIKMNRYPMQYRAPAYRKCMRVPIGDSINPLRT